MLTDLVIMFSELILPIVLQGSMGLIIIPGVPLLRGTNDTLMFHNFIVLSQSMNIFLVFPTFPN